MINIGEIRTRIMGYLGVDRMEEKKPGTNPKTKSNHNKYQPFLCDPPTTKSTPCSLLASSLVCTEFLRGYVGDLCVNNDGENTVCYW